MFSIRSAAATRAIAPRASRAYAVVSTRPLVQLFGVDGTYASALYTASAKNSSLETTEKSLQTLKDLLKGDPKLVNYMSFPMLNAEAKSIIITEVSKQIPSDKTVKNFLEVLAENNRLGLLGNVIDKFATLMSAYKGEIEVLVTSASKLDLKTQNDLRDALLKSPYVDRGNTLKLSNKVVPEIIGGIIVEIGERTIDLSVSAKMARLNKLLTDAL